MTVIQIFREDVLMDEFRMSNDTECSQNHITFRSNRNLENNEEYRVVISSNAVSDFDALCFYGDQNGNLYFQPYYVWLSAGFIRVTICFAEILIMIILFAFLQRSSFRAKPESVFLILSIILGFVYTFLMPCFRVPDEDSQFIRTYGILHGDFLVPADGKVEIPKFQMAWQNYTPFIIKKHFCSANIDTTRLKWDCVNMALYNPLSYIVTDFLSCHQTDLL